MKARPRLLLLALACLFASDYPGFSQTSFPMVWSVFPAGVERGKTSIVTVYAGGSEGGGGGNLYGAYKVFFEGEGIQAEIIPPEKGWPPKVPQKPLEVPVVADVKMRVTVSADAPLGAREFRIGTPRSGVSTVGLLVIGDDPEVFEQEANGDIEHAQSIALPCVVNGRLDPAEKIDNYRFKMAEGQEVVFTVLCARLEDKIHDLNVHADPVLTLRDRAGNELASNDDYYGADSMLHYRFDKAGDYVIQIRDVDFRGNANWVYRLTATTRPYVTGVVPCAVRPGQSISLHVTGFNLNGADNIQLDVPANRPPGIWEVPLKFPNGISNAVRLLVSRSPQVALVDRPNVGAGTPTGAGIQSTSPPAESIKTPLSVPGGVSSWIAAKKQVDRYSFHAKKDEAWGFEITARRLNSEMDSEIVIRDSQGNSLVENDDTFGKDSRIDWTAPADGDYTVGVRDVAGRAGPTYFYNLTAHRLFPDFLLRCDPDRAMVAPGNRTALFVKLERKNGFAGEVKVEVNGLPAGVTASPLNLPSNITQGVLVLTVAPNAKVDISRVQVIGTADLPGSSGKSAPASHFAQSATAIYTPGGGRGLVDVETMGVAVTEPNDLEVTANIDKITLAPGGTARIGITIKRRQDYAKPVTLDVMLQHNGDVAVNPLPPGIAIDEAASKTLLSEKDAEGFITLKAASDAAPVKDLPFAILGYVSVNFVMKTWFTTPPILLTVTPAPAK